MTKPEVTVVMNDLQIPFQDQPVLDLVLAFVRELKPRRVVLNGDVVDCYALSTHDKRRVDLTDIDVEKDQAASLMKALQDVPEKVWVGGNHEFRLVRYLTKNAPALGKSVQAPGLFAQQFNLKDHGFRWIPYQGDAPGKLLLGKLMVTHGFLVRQHSAVSAKAHFERLGGSVLTGHTHRLGVYYKTNTKGVHGSWENGCLCTLNPEYALYPDWQQGFSVVHVHPDGYFNVQQVPIIEGSFYFGQEKYQRWGRGRA